MALIPPDIGIRMRLQNEASLLQPTAPAHEISSDLPELRAGQRFTARILEVMPENTYKALVAGKQLTLQLPEGAKSGDTLELVVIDRTPKVVIARVAEASPQAVAEAGDAYPYAKLSSAGQMIGQLLVPEGETPAPAALTRGQALLPQPPASAAELAPVLQKAVSQSGLFYEAHQAQWAAGRLPTEQLLQEPQGRYSAPAAFEQHGLPVPVTAGQSASLAALLARPPGTPEQQGTMRPEPRTSPEPMAARAGAAADSKAPASLLQTFFGGGERTEQTTAPAQANPAAQAAAAGLPEELRPLVQQQLDAAATQRLVWHGEVWPNQTMEWEVVREDDRRSRSEAEDEPAWRTRLALETPRLGRVDASLRISAAGLQLTLTAPSDAAAKDLKAAAPALAASLDAAGITLLSFQIKHEPA